jgi:hypothetical protein
LKSYLIQQFEQWLYQQRAIHLPKARALSDEERARLGGYFERRILDLTRVASVERVSNPEFYDELTEREIPIPMDLTSAVGFTLIDCVLLRKGFESISTLFHEMVHVGQADLLGIRTMIELYLADLTKNGYLNVLFERQAYDLTAKFTRGESFSVTEIVRKELT